MRLGTWITKLKQFFHWPIDFTFLEGHSWILIPNQKVLNLPLLNLKINLNMFLPYHAKNQPHFQVSEMTYSHFMEIRKYAKISWFLQMVGNLKTSYKLKYVFSLPCQKISIIFRCLKGFKAISSKWQILQICKNQLIDGEGWYVLTTATIYLSPN